MAETNDSIPVGFCQCGCGNRTMIAKVTRSDRGQVRGQPLRFFDKHNMRRAPGEAAKKLGLRHCWCCKTDKADAEFHPARRGRKVNLCRVCATAMRTKYGKENPERIARLSRRSCRKNLYGMGPGEYDRLNREQGGLCAICGRHETRVNQTGVPQELHVDHDHGTGKVRGLLCNNCNRGIGLLGDDPRRLEAALLYLRERKGK